MRWHGFSIMTDSSNKNKNELAQEKKRDCNKVSQ